LYTPQILNDVIHLVKKKKLSENSLLIALVSSHQRNSISIIHSREVGFLDMDDGLHCCIILSWLCSSVSALGGGKQSQKPTNLLAFAFNMGKQKLSVQRGKDSCFWVGFGVQHGGGMFKVNGWVLS